MLEKQDLKEIKKIVDSGIDKIARTVNVAFEEQNEMLDKRFSGIENDIVVMKKEISNIRFRIDMLNERFDKLELKVDRIADMESEDLVAFGKEIKYLKDKVKKLEACYNQYSFVKDEPRVIKK